MEDILSVKSKSDIPELNIYQCGTYKMHSLKDAKKIAKRVLEKGIGKMSNKKLELDEALLEGV
jgi:S-ribosylhomocysteine lyase